MDLVEIGVVRTVVADEDISRRRREIVSTVEIFEEYAPALTGIEAYSHLFVLFYMHRATSPASWLVHPRRNADIPLTGALASRGRNHPNRIGLAVVELLARDGRRLSVRRLDAYAGTPVLDLKPYDHYDVFADISVPDWFTRRMYGR